MGDILKNGNRRIARLAVSKVAWGVVAMVLSQVLGMLPSLDFVSPEKLKLISFALAVILTASKGVELFFDQTMQLFKEHPEFRMGDTQEWTKQPEKPKDQ